MPQIYLTDPKQKFHLVDLLRGLSAIVILVWHYHHFYWSPESGLTPGSARQPFYEILRPFYCDGYWAVQLFWLISGFVFSHVYSHTHTPGKEFFIRRFARLYPLHFLTLCFIAVLQIISLKLFGYYQITAINDLYHFFLNLFFIAFWGFQVGSSFNTPFWSISIEEGIFFLFFLTHRYIFSFGIAIPLSILGFGAVISNYGTPMWYFGMCAWYFYTGVLIHYLVVKIKKDIIWWLLCSASLAVFYILLKKYINGTKIPFHNVEFFLFVPLLVLAIKLDLSGKFANKFFIKICDYISSLTYSSYLLHFPIQVFVLILFKYFAWDQGMFDTVPVFAIWIIFMVLLSRASYVFVERPLQLYFLTNLPKQLNLRRGIR
jgi:peptidoglycan/LPS O-acetylase OafA/YrhL